jgi:hypothetical protein
MQPVLTKPPNSGSRKVWIAGGLTVAAFLLAAPAIISATLMHPSTVRNCPQTTSLGDGQVPSTGSQPLTLQLRPTQKATLAFGRSQGLRSRVLQFDVTDNPTGRLAQGTLLAVNLDPFVRSDDAEMNARMMSARAEYRDGRVLLTLCATRAGSERLAAAGSYSGAVSIVDSRVIRVDVPFTVTLAYHGTPVVLELAILAAIAALWWVWQLSHLSDESSVLTVDGLARWVTSRGGFQACCFGLLAGAGALTVSYLRNPTWALDLPQVGTLLAAIFGSVVAAASAPAVMGRAPAAAARAAATERAAAARATDGTRMPEDARVESARGIESR